MNTQTSWIWLSSVKYKRFIYKKPNGKKSLQRNKKFMYFPIPFQCMPALKASKSVAKNTIVIIAIGSAGALLVVFQGILDFCSISIGENSKV